MQPLVSVIVPVYNAEKYLTHCLDNLCRQSLRDIEILLVDYMSTDKSVEICEQYATKDIRFKVIHHIENKGAAAARNTGIQQAVANYLMFVDSDDDVHEDFCKDAYECALLHNADVVIFGVQRINESERSDRVKKNTNCLKESGYIERNEAIYLLQYGFYEAVWNKLYKKKCFNNILFPEGNIAEDIGITYKIVWESGCTYFLNKVLYYYYYRENSVTTSNTDKYWNDYFEMIMQQYHDLANWGYPPDKLDLLLKTFAFRYCLRKKATSSDEHYNYFANILCTSIPKEFTWRQRIMCILLKYSPKMFELICIIKNKKA